MTMMTVGKEAVFLDTNVLIRFHVATAPDHQLVRDTLRQLLDEGSIFWISRQIIREYANVLTRPQPYAAPAAPGDVAAQLRLFEQHYRIADETALVSSRLYTLMETTALGGKQIHDANIVATMQNEGLTHLCTLNIADFARFSDLIEVISPHDVLPSKS
jgi:predicted nucleic acid-binding protein